MNGAKAASETASVSSSNAEAHVRAQAAKSLQAIGRNATEATPILLETLKDTDAQVREQAAKALRLIRPAADVTLPLFIKLADDEDVAVRLAAIPALWPMAQPDEDVQRVVDVLTTKLNDDHQKVRWKAAGRICIAPADS